MKFTVKNLKIAEFASEETLCYEATVYVDGVRAFTASNQGHGGPDSYDAFWNKKDGTADLLSAARLEKAIEWCKTQPLVTASFNDIDGAPFKYQPDLEHFVGEAVSKFRTEQDVKRMLKKFATLQDGKVYTYKCKPDHPTVREQVKAKHPDVVFLNDIPFEDAVAWVEAAA